MAVDPRDALETFRQEQARGRGPCLRAAATEAGRVRFVERGSPEWDRMWLLVCEDGREENPGNGECWQYMGTTWVGRAVLDFRVELVHQFRHRSHPEDGKRRGKSVPASTMLSWSR